MAYAEIAKKYLTNKRKEVVQWDERTGNIKIQIIGSDGKVEREFAKKARVR